MNYRVASIGHTFIKDIGFYIYLASYLNLDREDPIGLGMLNWAGSILCSTSRTTRLISKTKCFKTKRRLAAAVILGGSDI